MTQKRMPFWLLVACPCSATPPAARPRRPAQASVGRRLFDTGVTDRMVHPRPEDLFDENESRGAVDLQGWSLYRSSMGDFLF